LSPGVFSVQDEQWMQRAVALAQQAANEQEIPVGAVVVFEGKIIAEARNQSIKLNDPCAHAEILALRKAGEYLGNYRLLDCELFVTVEPCLMCAGALLHSRIKRLVFATPEPKAGAVFSQMQVLDEKFVNHKIIVESGLMAEQSSVLMSDFFKRRRMQQKASDQP
jgi:tRNA(adenine34) deaminase